MNGRGCILVAKKIIWVQPVYIIVNRTALGDITMTKLMVKITVIKVNVTKHFTFCACR